MVDPYVNAGVRKRPWAEPIRRIIQELSSLKEQIHRGARRNHGLLFRT